MRYPGRSSLRSMANNDPNGCCGDCGLEAIMRTTRIAGFIPPPGRAPCRGSGSDTRELGFLSCMAAIAVQAFVPTLEQFAIWNHDVWFSALVIHVSVDPELLAGARPCNITLAEGTKWRQLNGCRGVSRFG